MNQPTPTGPDLFGFAEAAYGKARAAGQHPENMFRLSWEPHEGDTPVRPTETELRDYRAQLATESDVEVTDG